MALNIVTVNVSQTVSPAPSNLQQMGAVLSTGATLLEPGGPQIIYRNSDITDLVSNEIQSLVAEATDEGTEFTLTMLRGHTADRTTGSQLNIYLKDCYPSEWNGYFTATFTAPDKLVWTRTDSSLKGHPTQLGTFSLEGSEQLVTAVNTFFAQGNSVGVYLLELGHHGGVINQQVSALWEYIHDPVLRFYTYLVPQHWDAEQNFINLTKGFTSNEAKQYFIVTTARPTNGFEYISPYENIKSVIAVCDVSNNAAAAVMWNIVSASPSEINKVPPMAFRYLQAVNAYPAKAPILSALTQFNVNYVGTGAEGGIANTLLMNGKTSDGKDITYWYSVDWVQINVDLQLANAVINGSNNPINPLYFNQDGIDRLQQVAQGVFNTGVAYGLVNGASTVNAVPFRAYVKNNPYDYGYGRYAGLSASYTPMRGFTSIIFNINVTLQLS